MLTGINNNYRQQMYFKSNFSMNDDEGPLDDRMPDRMPDEMYNANKGNNSKNYPLELYCLSEQAKTYLTGVNSVINNTERELIAQMIIEGLQKRTK